MDISQSVFNTDIGIEIILRTRTLNTHSRLQQLSPEELISLQFQLGIVAEEFSNLIQKITKPPTA